MPVVKSLVLATSLLCTISASAQALPITVNLGRAFGELTDTRFALHLYDFFAGGSSAEFERYSDVSMDLQASVKRRTTDAAAGLSLYTLGPIAFEMRFYQDTTSFQSMVGRFERPTDPIDVSDDAEIGPHVFVIGRATLDAAVARQWGVKRNVGVTGLFMMDIVEGVPGEARAVYGGCCQHFTFDVTPAVPEPAQLALLSLGILGVLRYGRPKRV